MFARTQQSPVLPPPSSTIGLQAWLRQNLFYSITSSIATLIIFAFVLFVINGVVSWGVINAVFVGDRDACQASLDGACWTFITHNFNLFVYGFFDVSERWRVDIALALFFIGIFWLVLPRTPMKKWIAGFMLFIYPVIAVWLLKGGMGLVPVSVRSWGGFTLTLVVAATGIVFSLPLGILLALGRRSRLPIMRVVSVTIIEFCRGVPFITVLFMSAYLLPFFLPADSKIDQLSRALIGVVIFSSAYMAEVIRGGLQALPYGQVEAAQAVGLGYWRIQGLIVLPQALKTVIPGIVNSYISLFKDTTLVTIISLLDFLGVVHSATRNSAWLATTVPVTSYVFMAAVFWICCWGMSLYSRQLENKLNTSHR